MSIEILSLIDHHHHAVMPRSFDVAELARYTLALGRNFVTKFISHFKSNVTRDLICIDM